MKIDEIHESTTSGAIATVATPMTGGGTLKRGTGVYPNKKGGDLLTGKKTNKKYANSVTESQKFTSKQQCIDYFVKRGKSAAQGAAAWDRGFRGPKPKDTQKKSTIPANAWWKDKDEINEQVDLKFQTVRLRKDKINQYSIKFFEAHNIDRPNYYFTILLHKMYKNHPILESVEREEIDHFVQTLNRLNSKKKIKVGDMFAVLSFIINIPNYMIDVTGFTTPKQVKEIVKSQNGTIKYVIFTDNTRYPRIPSATIGKHHADYPIYFGDEQSAKNALLQLKLILPDSWNMDTDAVNFSIKSNGDSMKINELKEAHLEEEDLILVPGQGHKIKTGFHPFDPDQAEHEGETVKNSLRTIVRNAKQLHDMLEDSDTFPEWVSEKIGSIKGMMTAVSNYMASASQNEGVIAGGGVGEGLSEGKHDSYNLQSLEHDLINYVGSAKESALISRLLNILYSQYEDFHSTNRSRNRYRLPDKDVTGAELMNINGIGKNKRGALMNFIDRIYNGPKKDEEDSYNSFTFNEGEDKFSNQRITVKKWGGNDANSYAVLVDGKPIVTGLSKREVPHYKSLAMKKLQEKPELTGKNI